MASAIAGVPQPGNPKSSMSAGDGIQAPLPRSTSWSEGRLSGLRCKVTNPDERLHELLSTMT
ncbi:hypothetical protein H6A35_02300 [Collinsella tanakaei]|nr:hypothetical protein [Collinsella tanakaei]